MRILLTNDDGIHAEGLVTLEKIARALTDDVWIVAPEYEQSGASRALIAGIGDPRAPAPDPGPGVVSGDLPAVFDPPGGALWSDEFRPGPIFLQGDHGSVSYRKLVLRPVVK
jgi:hypothetical protein